jgi:selenide,water dikinase
MLAQVLRPIQEVFEDQEAPDLLVGLDTPDDAAVWRLDDSRALVVTTDFFTPVVDDPHAFGAIAAANALSDLYAMGARPFLALNVAAIPVDLDPAIIRQIMQGGAEIVKQAGALLAGGHSVQDKEPKYGLVALGFVNPDQMFTKAEVQPGDQLILTKPLGTGVTTTALMRDQGAAEHEQEAIEWMTKLNGEAAEIAHKVGVRAATDITGFGLLGHALELADASGVGLRFDFESIPLLSGARAYAERGTFPSGSLDNHKYFGDRVRFAASLAEAERMLLFDAQTSGGLLLAVRDADRYMELAHSAGISAWIIGSVTGDRQVVEVVSG